MKIIILITLYITSMNLNAQQIGSFYDFTVKTIDGTDFPLSNLKGKKVLVVNTASKCGFTPQYKELEELYKKYSESNFTIIGFPANNFLWQEPGTNSQIKDFCQKNYGVTFQMCEKISVKGDSIAPLYNWLTKKEKNGVIDAPVKWNFQKFMISEDGRIIDWVSPKEKPNCDKIINWINNK